MSNNLFADVADFQRQVLGNTRPAVAIGLDKTPGYETTKKGLREELAELEAAIAGGNVGDQADALIDLVYFAIGGLFQMGVPAAACWNAVHAKNMTKVVGMTHRGTTNDATKPEGWTPPDLDVLVNIPALFLEAAKLLKSKSEDYNTDIKREDYFPFGDASYLHMLHTKMLRLRSLYARQCQGHEPNHEGLHDTLIDLANYASFYADFLRKQAA